MPCANDLFRCSASLLLMLLMLTACPAKSHGYNEFQRVFQSTYAGRDNPDFRKVVRKAKCYVCHQGKEDRKNCNLYGEAIQPHLGKKDKKDKEKIAAVLAEIADQLLDPEDESLGTFGDLIEAGKLPGGSLKDAKVEPVESKEAPEATETEPSES